MSSQPNRRPVELQIWRVREVDGRRRIYRRLLEVSASNDPRAWELIDLEQEPDALAYILAMKQACQAVPLEQLQRVRGGFIESILGACRDLATASARGTVAAYLLRPRRRSKHPITNEEIH